MSTIPIQLPDELRQFVEARVTQGQFITVSDYNVALVDAAKKKRTGLEVALIEGLESGPAEEWASQEWQESKQRIAER